MTWTVDCQIPPERNLAVLATVNIVVCPLRWLLLVCLLPLVATMTVITVLTLRM